MLLKEILVYAFLLELYDCSCNNFSAIIYSSINSKHMHTTIEELFEKSNLTLGVRY